DGKVMRAFQHELRHAAKQWHARGKPSGLVWRGATAQEALGHVKRRVLELSAVEQEFIAAIERRRLVWAASVAAVATAIVAGVAFAFVRISAAEHDARSQAAAAVEAQRLLQAQVKQLEEAQDARDAAETQKRAAERDLAQSKQLSREQLE